ncbi:hypothetical protein EON80_21695, partial [bacterium]
MPRITPLFALSATLLGGSLISKSVQAAPVSASSARNFSGAVPSSNRVFQSLGILSPAADVTRIRTLPPVLSNRTAKTQSGRSTSAVKRLELEFDNGFTEAQKNVLRRVRDRFLFAVEVFGEPAVEQQGKTIYVESDGPAAAYQPLLRPAAVDGGSIYFHYIPERTEAFNEFNFTRLYLLAFQGSSAFSYDYVQGHYVEAWQNGFADAAALLLMSKITPTGQVFDPSDLGTYTLPIYDFLNHPELGNAYIYSDKTPLLPISDFRAGMAQAAWLKVAVQDEQFFAKFNKAYYAKYAPRTTVKPSDLRDIAAGIVPNVEGSSFNDWIRRQYALDTNVTTGQKLYAAASPLPVLGTGERRAGFEGFAVAFTTDSTGHEEVGSTGYGSVNAFDEKGVQINSKSSELTSSNLLNFGTASDDDAGLALTGKTYFTGLGTPDSARISLQFRYKNAETNAVFPYISSTTATNITYYGVTSNGDSGSLSVAPNNSTSQTVTVARGAWAGTQK